MRRFEYSTPDLMRTDGGRYWFSGGVHRAAIVSFLLGAVATFFTTNAAKWQSPVCTHLLGGADISIPVGMIVAGGTYYLLRRKRTVEAGSPLVAERVGA